MDTNFANSTGPFKILIFVVCYNSEKYIERILDQIRPEIWQNDRFQAEVLLLDNQSPDQTFIKAHRYSQAYPERKITVLYNPKNLGYGGNQKIGCHYAVKNHFDAMVLLYGDGQYTPDYLPKMIEGLIEKQADTVLGSRMLDGKNALKNRIPLVRQIVNQILTAVQNRLLKFRLTEFHSGYLAYRVSALQAIPFQYNSDSYDFDSDILIQLLDTGKRIVEISIPALCNNKIPQGSRLKFTWKTISSCFLSRLNRLGLYYHPKFDYYINSNVVYESKFEFLSSHRFAYDMVRFETTVLDIGCGPGYMAHALEQKRVKTISIDKQILPETTEHSWKCIEANIETYVFDESITKIDTILLLDILEHLKSPEQCLNKLRNHFAKDQPEIIITTGNVGFFPIRLHLLFGAFHFGKRGILDMDHTRLFTFSSLSRLLKNQGYEILQKKGIPAPYPLAIGNGKIAGILLFLNHCLIHLSKGLFAYQIGIIAKPFPTIDCLLQQAQQSHEKLLIEENTRTSSP
jgi:glycosyltransferase involved in cell wall biosynthesis